MRIFAFSLVFFITACGFQPLYKGLGTEGPGFGHIAIQIIPDRAGQYLRNALLDRLGDGDGDFVYRLNVSPIEETRRDLDVTIESDTTRKQLRLETKFSFVQLDGDKIVIEQKIYALSSYNVLSNEYATLVSEDASREHALDDLARQIELQIALYMKEKN